MKVVVLFSGLFFLAVFLTSGLGGHFYYDICFSNKCYLEFYDGFEAALLLGNFLIKLILGLATVGGIFIALLTYVSIQGANALSNHLSHFSVFQDYVKSEIDRRPLVSLSSVDILKWYNFIFSDSRSGVTTVSDEYVFFVKSLNEKISYSNRQALYAEDGSFKYVPHQTRIIEALYPIGINIDRAPRNHFFEAEQEMFSVLSAVNREFCFGRWLPEIAKSKYL
ncbi:MAG: hypothetical protein ACJA0B_002107 [Alcanivorax borkumensis]|jgi:hypothetical protein|uniref:retron Ec48 family effector membrane protein n=1 Tax=Alcanivorax borkumensis TaxID=59754 RepID=UPI003EEAA277